MNREELLFTVRTLAKSLDGEAFTNAVRHNHASDLVEVLDLLKTEEVVALLMTLPAPERAALFAHFPDDRQNILLCAMAREAVVQLLKQLPSDDRADLFNRLSKEARQKLLPALARAEREDIFRLAAYPEGTAGSVTTSDYAYVAPHMTGAELERNNFPIRDLEAHAFGDEDVTIEATLTVDPVDGDELDALVAGIAEHPSVRQAFRSPSTTE